MAAKTIPGQTAEIAGPKKAFVIPKPEVAAAMIKRAKRALLVVGSDAINSKTRDGDLVDSAIRLGRMGNMTVVATGHLVGEFRRRGDEDARTMPLMNLGDRLRDPGWGGFDGGGPYDLALFVGLPYYMEWLVLSGLKSFAPELRTVSLERAYQPNASWTLGNTAQEEWEEIIDRIASILEGK
ncbi:hypothetical protein AC482_03380 [miscellaneous Crenarchaeota group-15 archaeon DG-45]|uniref:CO dehydrogenase/acetyl-CoA synthase complex subunit epsilon n=1 Tax=miscellaneous Crenarchaeota group-15 archaeon DG-45 TaxID=1685127 RepID=A0A0M0BQ02_9ARCH|nr:MAG: hypothetical protein AC482_03380 [miscellaneous Crenarchaeota group-15 archaeon DG-45]